eukprot:TRINITY_DN1390_c0_g1_i1.p1 TRINITY_DN1390_c0_g1~~TRINITY_DN1390_c0_g1_i1.p1  ORF type:complete len:487 (+),score=104.16 TRINITY_DN1390_c0_g1_i1:163-1461(+)
MCHDDIRGSIVYAQALVKINIITQEECDKLIDGLQKVDEEWRTDTFVIKPEIDEDIHTANERRLGEVIGTDVSGKLHTGRSRNDQVATDVRLWIRTQEAILQQHLNDLITTAVKRAELELDIVLPGYTHLQPAQPVRWSHWMLSHAFRWQRDAERLSEIRARLERCPLGSGALAGHPFGIDRQFLAAELGFTGGPCPNSLDAVSDRDFIVEFLFWASLHMTHLSQFAEDLIIYASREFGYVRISDAYSTGSSLMPQKKNPDALELLRGKAGRVQGQLMGLLATLKSLPTCYNKDMQEDKEPLFDCVDTMAGCIPIANGVLATLEPQAKRMESGLDAGMLATDLADYLVRKGVPFRTTHHLSGECVVLAEKKGVPLNQLTPEDLRTIHPAFSDDVTEVWSFQTSVERRDAIGGTSKRAVLEQVATLKKWLNIE